MACSVDLNQATLVVLPGTNPWVLMIYTLTCQELTADPYSLPTSREDKAQVEWAEWAVVLVSEVALVEALFD